MRRLPHDIRAERARRVAFEQAKAQSERDGPEARRVLAIWAEKKATRRRRASLWNGEHAKRLAKRQKPVEHDRDRTPKRRGLLRR